MPPKFTNTGVVRIAFQSEHFLDVEIEMIVPGRFKGFVGPRHFSSLGPFGDSTSIVGTTVYSRLSRLMEGGGMHV
jgi:hypothetical protein